MARADREDLSQQETALAEARADLAAALELLATDAKNAARKARAKRGQPDLDQVRVSFRAFERAEETVDLAAYDLQTAAGADG